MDDLKTMPPSERDELNEHLDELRRSQQGSVRKKPSGNTSGEKKRSCLGCLIGTLVAIGGLFLFWRTACRPQVLCYCIHIHDDDYPSFIMEEDVKPTCYEIAIPDDNDIPDTESSPAVLDSDAALEEVQQYYEKVKLESSVNNVDNAETSDEPTE